MNRQVQHVQDQRAKSVSGPPEYIIDRTCYYEAEFYGELLYFSTPINDTCISYLFTPPEIEALYVYYVDKYEYEVVFIPVVERKTTVPLVPYRGIKS